MTEIATIDWFGRWGTSVFSENIAIFKGWFCLFLYKNIRCGYSLESPWRGDSNEDPQHRFNGELTKIILQLSSNTLLIFSSETSILIWMLMRWLLSLKPFSVGFKNAVPMTYVIKTVSKHAFIPFQFVRFMSENRCQRLLQPLYEKTCLQGFRPG